MAKIRTAQKSKQKLRLGITGLAGSGKTYSALRIATGIGGKILVVDSEHASSELYADKFNFDICPLETFEIEEYVDAIETAGNEGYSVVVIDSLSHAWEKLLERVDKIADQRYRGNTFRAWAEGGELQKKLVEAILSSSCHVIGTIRTKAEYALDNDAGKTKITKLGTAPKQREGFEYELSLVMEINHKHSGFISKDRTGKFQDKFIEMPGEEFGQQLIAWLNEGETSPDQQNQDIMKEIGRILKSVNEKGEALFTEAEYNSIKTICRDSAKKQPEERHQFLSKVLDEQKKVLADRLDALSKPVRPYPSNVQSAATSVNTAPAMAGQSSTATSKPETPLKKEYSMMDEFKQVVAEKEKAKQAAAAIPSMYSEPEDDGFEDDIPGAVGQEPEPAQLDIF
jgi:hypothetical protein